MKVVNIKATVYFIVVCLAALPSTMAFASAGFLNNVADYVISKDTVNSSDTVSMANHHAMYDHATPVPINCDTDDTSCHHCDNCSHCIILVGIGFQKSNIISIDHITTNYTDQFRSIAPALLLRPPIHS